MQTLQRFFYTLLPVPRVISFDLGLQGVQIQALGSRKILVADADHPLQAFGCCLEDRGCGVQGGLLRDKGNAHPLLYLQCAIIRLGQASQNLEKRRLARAIAANQANTLRSLQRKAGVVQQCNMPKCELGVQ